MAKDHVTGTDKISGNHTTFIEAAVPMIKQVVKLDEVRRVVPGFIQSGLDTLQKYSASVKITIGLDEGYHIHFDKRENVEAAQPTSRVRRDRR